MKKIYLILTLLIGLLVVAGCTNQINSAQPTASGKINIAATFYPVYDLTKSIAGSSANTYSIVPPGVEPHGYEPSPGDIQKLNRADVFVTLGIEFEEFEEDLVESVNPTVSVIPAGANIALLQFSEEKHEHDGHEEESHEDEHHGHGHEDEEEHIEEHEENEADHDDHHHSGDDPHIWLSPKNAQKMAFNIMQGLTQADPANKESYLANGQQLMTELQALDKEFQVSLSSCNKDVILVNHNAFSYLARDYGFTTIEISGLEPEAEPTPKQLAKLIEEAQEHGLKYVFYEELVDSRVARTIAREVGATVLPLSPIASDLSTSYSELMGTNLENLKIALECQA